IDDPMLASLDMALTCDATTLAAIGDAGDRTTCHAGPYVITATDVATMTELPNTAIARGTLPEPPGGGTPVPVESNEDDAEVPLAPSPAISLVKSATLNDTNGDGVGQLGETITFGFQVTNTGDIALSSVSVDDPKLAARNISITCEATDLAPGQTTACTSEPYLITVEDTLAGPVDNVATATGEVSECPACEQTRVTSPPDETTTPTSVEMPLLGSLGLIIDKTAVLNDDNGNGTGQAGETITFSFQVTNVGDSDLNQIRVDDPMLESAGVAIACEATELAVGASTMCVAEPYTITEADVAGQMITNVATATGQGVTCGDECEIVSLPDETHTPTVQIMLPASGAGTEGPSVDLWALLPLLALAGVGRRVKRG
ncbi:MAG: hypothetical protein ACK5KO_07735, partial [Arachnia sp.]